MARSDTVAMPLNSNPVVLFVLVIGLTVVTTGQTTATSNKSERKGILKRSVVYRYVTDRPPMPKSNLIQTARNLKTTAAVSPLTMRQTNHGFPQKYNAALLQKLYGKRRSDINLPALGGTMLDYKERRYQDLQDELAKHLKEYENMDINKKYASQMQSLTYYPTTKTSIPGQHIDLPQENYLSPIQATQPSPNSLEGLSQYSQEANQPGLFRKDGMEEERLLEEEKLKELEELRGKWKKKTEKKNEKRRQEIRIK